MGISASLGGLVTVLYCQNKAESSICPFNRACLHYDDVQTKAAVKRVLTLLIENNVPNAEIKQIIDHELK